MAISNDIKWEVEIRVITHEKRYFNEMTGDTIEEPKWEKVSDEANYEGKGIVEAIRWLLNYLHD